MNPQEYIRKIAAHYPDSDSIRRILEFASVDTLNIDLDGKPLNTWFLAMKEVMCQNKVSDFIQHAATEYPSLKLEQSEIEQLKNFLSGTESKYFINKKVSVATLFILGVAFLAGSVLILMMIKKNNSRDGITIVLHQPGNRSVHPVSSLGILKLQDTAYLENSIVRPVKLGGIVKIEKPPGWLYTGKVRMNLQGLDNDSITYSVSSRIYSFQGNDTVWVEIFSVPKKIEPPLNTFEFVRLKYNTREFDFLSGKSALQLKKYLIFNIDGRPELFADRHVMWYMGEEIRNEILLYTVDWLEDRSLQLEYKMVPIASQSYLPIRIEGVNLQEALIFIGGQSGKVTQSEIGGSQIVVPKLVGTYNMEIFYGDSLATISLQTGYSDIGKSFTRDEFISYSKKIRKVLK